MAGPSTLETHLGYWLRLVSNHVSQAFAQKVARHGVTVAEWVVLRRLFDGGTQPPSAIAANLGMTRGAISKLIDRLEAKMLITRTHDLADHRFQAIRLTERGRALVPSLAALADANDDEFFGDIDLAERMMVETLLRQIAARRDLRTAPVD